MTPEIMSRSYPKNDERIDSTVSRLLEAGIICCPDFLPWNKTPTIKIIAKPMQGIKFSQKQRTLLEHLNFIKHEAPK